MAWDITGQSWTAAELVADVRRVASLPTTSTDFTDLVILREATDVLWGFAGWAMQQAGDGRLVELLQRPVTGLLTSDYRAGSECELPPLAIADTVESVVWLNSQGTAETRLARIDHAQQATYDDPGRQGQPEAYALLGGRIRLYPRPDQGGTVRILYQRRHPVLVPDSPATIGTVSSVAASGTTATVLFWSTAQAPFGNGDVVDLLNNQAPYRVALSGAAVASITGTTAVTVTAPLSLLSNLVVSGTRVVRTGTSPYVHYPLELRPAVTEQTAANLMRRVGDLQNAQASAQTAREELARVLQILSPRSKRDRVRAINPYSLMRTGMRRGWIPR